MKLSQNKLLSFKRFTRFSRYFHFQWVITHIPTRLWYHYTEILQKRHDRGRNQFYSVPSKFYWEVVVTGLFLTIYFDTSFVGDGCCIVGKASRFAAVDVGCVGQVGRRGCARTSAFFLQHQLLLSQPPLAIWLLAEWTMASIKRWLSRSRLPCVTSLRQPPLSCFEQRAGVQFFTKDSAAQ